MKEAGVTGGTVGQALVAGLAARGVGVVFGIPGVHTVELYRGLAGSGIRHVTARHEQGAAFMADGQARVTGRPGVAFVITGPGLTNALTAMAQARADSVPVLVVSGVNARGTAGRGLGLLHELPDQGGMVATLCPSFRVGDAAGLGPALDAAWVAMTAGRPGPAHLEVPLDVMAVPAPPLPPPAATALPPAPAEALLADAAARLAPARRAVILAGGGCRGAEAGLRLLAERLDAPVVQTVNARGLMHGHPLTLAASASLEAVRALIAGADAVVAIGTEIGQTDYDMYARGGLPDLSGMIRIDRSAALLAARPAAVAIQADAAVALAALAARVAPRRADGAARSAAARAAALAEIGPAMRAQAAMVAAIRDAVPGAVIVGDSTQPVYAANLVHDHDRPGGWFNAATGYGALGYAPGAAVGAALATPARPVVCLTGDGGLMFSPGELMTAVDERLPVTVVVWNNRGFREIAEAMAGAGASVIGCDPTPPDMAALAAAFGLPFARVAADPAALAAALRRPCDGPRMIEVAVSPA
jgi:acetolactate synthase-1/2/3 large subunit